MANFYDIVYMRSSSFVLTRLNRFNCVFSLCTPWLRLGNNTRSVLGFAENLRFSSGLMVFENLLPQIQWPQGL